MVIIGEIKYHQMKLLILR